MIEHEIDLYDTLDKVRKNPGIVDVVKDIRSLSIFLRGLFHFASNPPWMPNAERKCYTFLSDPPFNDFDDWAGHRAGTLYSGGSTAAAHMIATRRRLALLDENPTRRPSPPPAEEMAWDVWFELLTEFRKTGKKAE